MNKERLAQRDLHPSLIEAKKKKRELDFLVSVQSADSPLESRKREAGKPLYLTRYE
jgi:hypothetical protein